MSNSHLRKNFHEWFKLYLNTTNVSKDAIKAAIIQRADLMTPAYGLANWNDFGDYADFVSKALAYNNKQFYVYRAIENPNKIGFLSHKQYRRMVAKPLSSMQDFLRANGKMSSPYKLFKKALKENPRMASYKNFFKINDEGDCTHEDKLIEICDLLLSKTLGLTMEETSIQACYDLNLPDRYNGSGHRYATHSCMQGKPIGKFYESLPCHGIMIKRDGVGIGRFLLWDLPDGRQYVDRLYCRETEADACLELIDSRFPEALKYPLDDDTLVLDIKFKSLDAFETQVVLPYVDSFPYMLSRNNELCLSNSSDMHNGFQYQQTIHFASGGTGYVIRKCPHCGKVWFGYRSDHAADIRNHKYICSAYKPRDRKLQAYLSVYRKMEDELGGLENGTEGFVFTV